MKNYSLAVTTVMLSLALFSGLIPVLAQSAKPPVVGDTAPEFVLTGLDGKAVKLPDLLKDGSVSLVVLRGFPGYQCPLCTKQVGELLDSAEEFSKLKTTVVLIYPGSAKGLNTQAKEFIGSREFPANFRFLLDPDYKLTNAYGLRWDAPNETAYPSSFVIGRDGKIAFAKVSKSHGGRVSAKDLLRAVAETK